MTQGAQQEMVGGRYEIQREIARGGMGVVYEARHRMTKRTVALKVLFPHIGKDPSARQRFLREVSAPAQIGHPGIVEVFDADFDPNDGSLFVAMEFIRGETFRDWLARGGHTRAEVLDAFDEILEALSAAHSNGIVHRDLKPENIIFAEQREGKPKLKILDFGIARDLDSSAENVTHTGIAMGTPHYMAPEQAMSARGVTAAADVWAIGAMIYEALTGRTPFIGETASAIVVHACTAPHEPLAQVAPTTPPALASLIDRCLSKKADERPRDAATLLRELREVRGRAAAAVDMPTAPARPAGNSPAVPTPQPITSPAGPVTAPGGAPNGFGTGPTTGGGNAGGGFGTANAAFGTPPPGSMSTPSPHASTTPPTQSSGGMNWLWIVGGAGVGLLAVIGLAIGLFMMKGSGGDTTTSNTPVPNGQNAQSGTPQPPPTPTGANGSIIVLTDVPNGELVVDGVSRGIVQHGAEVPMTPGAHNVAIQSAGQVLAQASVQVMASVPSQVRLMRAGGATPTPPTGSTSVPAGPPTTQTGALAQGDRTLNSGEFVDHFTFNWNAGERYAVDVQSSNFDTYLIIKPPNGGAQMDNDDRTPGQGTNAGTDVDVTVPGTWEVLVTSYRPGEVGDYTLVVQRLQ